MVAIIVYNKSTLNSKYHVNIVNIITLEYNTVLEYIVIYTVPEYIS